MEASLAPSIIAAASGLVGALIGGVIVNWGKSRERRQSRIREQLDEFYGPLAALRDEILAKSMQRVEISSTADSAWREEIGRLRGNPDAMRDWIRQNQDKYHQIVDYHNQQLRSELLPAYRRMISIFRDHLSLAEPDTRKHFHALVGFVAFWDRDEQARLPREVIEQLDYGEENLFDLYDDIAEKLRTLTRRARR